MRSLGGLGDAVWSRTGQNVISRQQFNLLYGFFTIIGLVISAIGAAYSQNWVAFNPELGKMEYGGPNILMFALAVLALGIAGVVIALKSDRPAVSFLGYMMVALPFGLLLGPVVAGYEIGSVVNIIVITAVMVGVLTVIGVVIPDSLESWGGWLFGGLVILLVGSLGMPFLGSLGVPVEQAMSWMDWFGVLLFSAYVIYDVNRAQRVPATVDNSIDCALALYLDIVNIFIRLLELYGKKK